MSNDKISLEVLQNVVSDLNANNIGTKDALEKTFGFALTPDGETSAFHLSQARDLNLRGLAIDEVSHREPIEGSGATAGSILIIHLKDDVCFDRDEVLAAYPTMKIDAPPSPENPDPSQYFSDETNLTSLSFGFSTGSSACLREIIFSLKQS
ncbi:hypothetical protein RMR10_001480 [Agrobacterium rosae]|uniref:hypothetical protein n=1 Tax=Agrobacterium rosae TaxID=1972867 RepID=UPI002A0C4274|nr:hypothetical protein [Agrobacterium rosae]MDX8314458.1 hypothetical protein [Agrobacterium rosae]